MKKGKRSDSECLKRGDKEIDQKSVDLNSTLIIPVEGTKQVDKDKTQEMVDNDIPEDSGNDEEKFNDVVTSTEKIEVQKIEEGTDEESEETQGLLPEISELDVLETVLTHMNQSDIDSNQVLKEEPKQNDDQLTELIQNIESVQSSSFKEMKEGMDELEEVSELEPTEATLEYHPDLFSSIVDPEKEHPIWSILTETIT